MTYKLILNWNQIGGLTSEREVRALELLQHHLPELFPLQLPVAEDQSVAIESPAAFSRESVPQVFHYDSGRVRVPLSSFSGWQLVLDESPNPNLIPATLVLETPSFSDGRSHFDVMRIFPLFTDLVEELVPDVAFVSDSDHLNRPEYDERLLATTRSKDLPIAIFWMTYLSGVAVSRIGKEKLERFVEHLPSSKWLDDGVAFSICEEAYSEGEDRHRQIQREAEVALGLWES